MNWIDKYSKLFSHAYLLILGSLISCVEVPDDFVAPSYNIKLSFPVVDSVFTMFDFIDEETNIIASDDPNSLGQLIFVDKDPLTTFEVGDNLKIDGFFSQYSETVKSIKIDDIPPISAPIGIEDWTPFESGSEVVFQEIESNINSDFDSFDQFVSARFDDGIAEIQLINRLPVDIEVRDFTIKNKADNSISLISTQTVIPIPKNGESTISIDLAGTELSNTLYLDAVLYTSGSEGNVIKIPDETTIEIIATFNNLDISRVKGVLPAQDPFGLDSSIVINDSTKIEKAVIDKGSFLLTFNNFLDLDIIIDLHIENLLRDGGTQFFDQIFLSASEINKIIEYPDIKNWSVVSNFGDELSNELRFEITVNIPETNEIKIISKEDYVEFSAGFEDLILSYFSGIVKPINFAIDDSEFYLNLDDFSSKFTFDEINIDDPGFIVRLDSKINYDMDLYGKLSGQNQYETKRLDFLFPLKANNDNIFDLRDYGLKEFINGFTSTLPEKFIFSGDVIINPDYLYGNVNKLDSVSGQIDHHIPLRLGISGGSYEDIFEIDTIEVKDEDIELINSAILFFDLENGIGTDIRLSGNLLDKTGNVYQKIPPSYNSIHELKITSPNVDEEGNIIDTKKTIQSFELQGEDARQFLRNRILELKIRLNTPPNNDIRAVKLKNSDTFHLKIYTTIDYKLNGE